MSIKLESVFLLPVAVLLITAPVIEAQQQTRIPRIGRLAVASQSSEALRIDAFRQGLRKLGYVEGKNIEIEWRFANGELAQLPAQATELVRLKVDVIVTSGSTPTGIAKATTS